MRTFWFSRPIFLENLGILSEIPAVSSPYTCEGRRGERRVPRGLGAGDG